MSDSYFAAGDQILHVPRKIWETLTDAQRTATARGELIPAGARAGYVVRPGRGYIVYCRFWKTTPPPWQPDISDLDTLDKPERVLASWMNHLRTVDDAALKRIMETMGDEPPAY